MDYETKVWIVFWTATILASIIGSILYYNVEQQRTIRMMVDKGANPIEAACAVYGSTQSIPCALYISKR